MKLRKILSRTIALVSCVAMLSTNVMAAVTVNMEGDGDGFKVTVNGAPKGYFSFYAMDEGFAFSAENQAKVQYVAQAPYNGAGDIVIPTFLLRNEADKLDLYVNGAKIKTVSTKNVASLKDETAEYTYVCIENANEIEAAQLPDLQQCLRGMVIESLVIGAEGAEDITYLGGDDSRFAFEETLSDPADNKRILTVKYNGVVAGNVTINGVVNPPKTLKAFGFDPNGYNIWVDTQEEKEAFDGAKALAFLQNIPEFNVRYSLTYDDANIVETNPLLPMSMLEATVDKSQDVPYVVKVKLRSQVIVPEVDAVNPIDIFAPEEINISIRVRAKSEVDDTFVKLVDKNTTLDNETAFNEAGAAVLSVPAAVKEDAPAHTMDWNRFKAIVRYNNPEYLPGVNDTQYFYEAYDYSNAFTMDKFTIEGWKEYSECKTIGEQTVTLKIADNDFTGEENGIYTKEIKASITNAVKNGKVSLVTVPVISVYQGTSEQDALTAIMAAENLFYDHYTDDSKYLSAAKITGATIEGYLSSTLGAYNVTITEVGDDPSLELVGGNTFLLYVEFKSTNTHSAGTVVGGGGIQTGPKKEEEKPVDPVTPPAETVAPDVPANHWAAEAITSLVEKKIVSGDASGNIRPNDNITREEVAKIVAVAQGLAIEGNASNVTDSSDVSDWAKPYVDAVVKAGAFSGNADGTFAPKVAITREQFAAVIVRAYGFGESDKELAFADVNMLEWSKPFVAKAVELGIVNGYEDNTFKPGAQITRAEAFAMLTRAMALKEAAQETPVVAE